ncbi:MAG: glycosyltransferase family 2 protein [Phycisphaerales bacterium JB040]
MTALAWISLAGLLLALPPFLLTLRNLSLFAPPPRADPDDDTPVTVAIPARNEESNIADCLGAVLASTHPNLEVLVYDDDSTDDTPGILARLEREHTNLRRAPHARLPRGWVGKQHACHRLAQHATGEYILFIDADVRLEPDAVGRALAFAKATDSALVSTFPRQIVRSLGELLLVPNIFFILLSYLPLDRMRSTLEPATSAACGQFVLARADAYHASGGHARCRDSMHDGIRLPRLFRRAGFRTDLFDGTSLASVRMYRGPRETWNGFVKNTYEALGSPVLLAVFTVVHLLAQVAPWAILAHGVANADPAAAALAGACVLVHLAHRTTLARRFRHPLLLVPLHPMAILALTANQWHSYALTLTGRRVWRGRPFTPARSHAALHAE